MTSVRTLLMIVAALSATSNSETNNTIDIEETFNCSSNETVPKQLVCNWQVDCSNGEDEKPTRCDCPPGKFNCGESCIDENLRCNRKAECPNSRDEENCDLYPCQAHQFKCSNNFCIAANLTCDYKDDCGDSSDEQNCQFRRCWSGELECETGECVRPGHICDGIKHCKNGQDEMNCNPGDFVACEDGTRIHRSLWCDGNLDCRGNHADETVCGKCPSGHFQCPNGRCLSKALFCDGRCDCVADCSDENGDCSASYQVVHGLKLPILEVSVGCLLELHPIEEELIILDRFICDGVFDCYYYGYAPDEFNCPGSDLSSLVYGETEYWSSNTTNYFQCSGEKDGRWLPSFLKCDFKKECLHGDDELDCDFTPCEEGQFQCNNHQCIGMDRRCDSKLDCFDKSDELYCESFDCGPLRRKCKTHQCIPAEFWCDHEKDCIDGSDEAECDYPVTCSEDEFRCDSGQCIPKIQVCLLSENKKEGCADKSHLTNCRPDSCDLGWFKCTEGPCIHNSYVCNEEIDCPAFWNDEDLCLNMCSKKVPGCMCFGITANCTGLELVQIPTDIEAGISFFNFSGNLLGRDLQRNSLAPLRRSNSLDLSNNQITVIPPGLFNGFTKLKILQLKRNRIQTLLGNTFQGLRNLHMLYLEDNIIDTIHSLAFNGLSSLRTLNLSKQNLQYVSPRSFVGLNSLLILDLSHNNITYFDGEVFTGLSVLQRLDISFNRVIKLQPAVFHGLNSIKQLLTDEFRICCIAMHAGITQCSPAADEFSSCQDLMSHVVLRPCIWVLGILALCGNLYVIIWRMCNMHRKKSHTLVVVNLAIGDFCMGIYLLLIGAMDHFYRGVYAMHDQEWRNSWLCTLAGVISTFSSELTVFILTAITSERLLSILFPFCNYRMTTRTTRKVIFVSWVLASLVALIPLLDVDYFRNFYGRSSVCLALHITADRPNGWEYSFSIFVVLNFISICIMCTGYAWMYSVARSSTQAIRRLANCEERAMRRKMLIIVFTDAACWIPTVTLGFLSLSGYYVAKDIYAWVAVFVLPFNAALNPFIYTLMVPNYKEKIWRYLLNLQTSVRSTFKFSDSSRQLATTNAKVTRSNPANLRTAATGRGLKITSVKLHTSNRNAENQSMTESKACARRAVHISFGNLGSENFPAGKLHKIQSCPELT